MNQLQLYINDRLVDLADDSPIALTFQINNLAEVKNQQGNTSNQFKIPLTQRNRQILGSPDDIAFTNCKPYDYYGAKIIQDGLEIVPYGMATLNSVDGDTAAITVLSGNVDFFDAIDYKIYDLGDSTTAVGKQKPFEKFDHNWTLDNVVSSQTHLTGWIWPLIDYGTITYVPNVVTEIDVRNLRPGFFLKTAVEEMVAQTGFKIDPGSFLFNEPLFSKLIVQFANDDFDHGVDFKNQIDDLGVTAKNFSDQQLVTSIKQQSGIINLTVADSDNRGQWLNNNFVSKQAFTAVVELVVPKLYLKGYITETNATVLEIYLSLTKGGNITTQTIEYNFANGQWTRYGNTNGGNLQGYHTFDMKKTTGEFDLNTGDKISATYQFKGKQFGNGFGSNPAYGIAYSGITLTIRSKNNKVLFGQNVQCERIFPDITQKDLLKDTLQRFGVICQTNIVNRTITFASFRDIINNIPMAKNWSTKCIDQGKSITFQLGGYAQINYMQYKEDENVMPQNFAKAQINIADKTLPSTAALFESQFAATQGKAFTGGSIAQITKVEPNNNGNTDFSISTQPRLLIDKKFKLDGNTKLNLKDGATSRVLANDIVSIPYFIRSDEKDSLHWEELRLKYYPELEKILQQTKKVVRYFMLTPCDILELNFLIPVYLEQDSAYYYINKIDSWRKGQPVKVELVKLG